MPLLLEWGEEIDLSCVVETVFLTLLLFFLFVTVVLML